MVAVYPEELSRSRNQVKIYLEFLAKWLCNVGRKGYPLELKAYFKNIAWATSALKAGRNVHILSDQCDIEKGIILHEDTWHLIFI
jgi:hypothetical protein